MWRNDYLMRMATEFGQALTYVVGLRTTKHYQEALAAMDETMRRWLGLDSKSVLSYPTATLQTMLSFNESDDIGRDKCVFLAALLEAQGDTYLALELGEEAYVRHLAAFDMLIQTRLRFMSADFPAYAPSLDKLYAKLDDYVLPEPIAQSLLLYYEQNGAFVEAENLLFETLGEDDQQALRATGVAFYERLLAHDDATLLSNGLPRGEVEAGLAELRTVSDGSLDPSA